VVQDRIKRLPNLLDAIASKARLAVGEQWPSRLLATAEEDHLSFSAANNGQ
jgi:hypothetical protein